MSYIEILVLCYHLVSIKGVPRIMPRLLHGGYFKVLFNGYLRVPVE